MTIDLQAMIQKRNELCGNHMGAALVSQELKRVMRHHLADLDCRIHEHIEEALDMMAHEMGRIIGDNPTSFSAWANIAFYAQQVANMLEIAND
jgi:hypothetical protein